MKTLLSTFILIANLGACSLQNDDKLPGNLNLDGIITIHIKSVPQSENILVKLGTYHSFPQSDVSVVQDTITFDSTEIYLKGPCRTLGGSFLHIADSTYEVVGAPGDTINVSILADRIDAHERPFLSFEGKSKEVQQYYLAKKQHLNDPMQACMNEGLQASTLKPFMEMMDATYQKQYQFWMNYQKTHTLPDWFRVYETNVLNYSDAWLRVYMVWYQMEYQRRNR